MVCAVMLALAVGHIPLTTLSAVPRFRPHVLIDAGHGGMDGGAVAADGTEEKTLNLLLAGELAHLLRLCGYEVQLTRDSDTALDVVDGASIRENKVRDMKARLALYEQAELVVSVHQNMFGSASCQGSQVFYAAGNPLSKRLGSLIREELVTRLQPDNERELKAGSKDIYLLFKTTRPTVLVEGGFLSNAEDLRRLKSDEERRRLGFAIACGVIRYTKPNGGDEQS